MKTALCALLAAAVTMLLASCTEPFGARDNPVDPGAGTYQGFQTVRNVAAVAPEFPAEGASSSWFAFVCSHCDSADLYAIRITDSAGAVVYERGDFTTHVLSLADASLVAGTHTWSVRAREAGEDWAPSWSTGRTVVLAAGVAGAVTPADGATTIDTTPLLDWGDVADAASYEVQMADSASGVASGSALTAQNSQYEVTSPYSYDTTAYWRVRPVNADGVPGAWTRPFAFTVAWTIDLGTIFPADLGTTVDTTPLLDWGDVPGAASYELQIADSAAGVAGAEVIPSTESQYQVMAASAYDTTLHWRVRPLNEDGVPGAWTQVFAFTLGWSVDFGSVSPPDLGTTSDTTPLLDWGDVPGAASYELQIADSAAGLAIAAVISSTESQYQVPLESAFPYGMLMYWRIRAINGDSVNGPWSTSFRCGIEWTVDFAPLFPVDGGTAAVSTPLLDWGDVPGAASYEVQIADSAAGLAIAAVISSTESQYQVPLESAFPYGMLMYWRIRAINSDGVPAGWSAHRSLVFGEPLLPMVTVSGGMFQMGSSTGAGDEQPVHSVTLSSFLMGKDEVTQTQYQSVVGSNPASGYGVGSSFPVYYVTWFSVLHFCNVLSRLEGLNPCYTIDGSTVTVDWNKNGYRLPTEAEWEFAARGGMASQGYTYSGSNSAGEVAWYTSNSGYAGHAVGTKTANELGIHDMSGNVREWCWDWYGSYGSEAQTDPTGPTSGTYRVLRGGSWDHYATYVGCSNRGSLFPKAPDNWGPDTGFRVVRRAD